MRQLVMDPIRRLLSRIPLQHRGRARHVPNHRVPFDPEHRPPPGQVAQTARKFLVVVGIAVLLALAWLLRNELLMVFLAMLIAAALHGPVRWLEERRLPRIGAIAVVYLALSGLIGGAFVVIVPPLVEQAQEFIEELPDIIENLVGEVTAVVDRIGGPGAGEDLIDAVTQQFGESPDGETAGVAAVPFAIVNVLVSTVIIFFLSALLLLERDAIRGWTMHLLVARDRAPVMDMVRNAFNKLGRYVSGQLLIMLITGVGAASGMLLLGVPFALPMGLLAFLAEAIPIAGPFISGIPIVALAFLESPGTGLLMLVWMVALQQIEGLLLYPVVHGRVLSLSPAIVLIAVVSGASLAGVLGAIIAIPVVAVIDVAVREIIFPLRERQSRRDTAVASAPDS
jgi:predicted PurR-regulated permease PerM